MIFRQIFKIFPNFTRSAAIQFLLVVMKSFQVFTHFYTLPFYSVFNVFGDFCKFFQLSYFLLLSTV